MAKKTLPSIHEITKNLSIWRTIVHNMTDLRSQIIKKISPPQAGDVYWLPDKEIFLPKLKGKVAYWVLRKP